MASLIPDYNYDIFISYRQKDNKYDGWVTEFVDNLKKELESTFKEEVSVYFDINPSDGLLETHDVDASLKEKLKCLILIPIISRTYCDPNAFAWEYEFKAFIAQALKDQFGLKVKLSKGNVGNRILPIRIHDLDSADIRLCELALGSVLRSVDFIYKASGVNRSLRSKDDDIIKNPNQILYRDQINKVAMAIKDIIEEMKKHILLTEAKANLDNIEIAENNEIKFSPNSKRDIEKRDPVRGNTQFYSKRNKFWNILKEHKIIRFTAIYTGCAFLIFQVVGIIFPALGLPSWLITFILFLLIIGLVFFTIFIIFKK
jgi:hypothetical protein